MSWRYFRLFLIALFLWVAVLGLRSGSWRLVILPFLALGALFIVRETLQERFPKFGRELGAVLVTLVCLYNLYFSFPTLRSWLLSEFPQSTVATERLKQAVDLEAAEKMEPAALASRQALHQYLLRKEDIVGQRIKADLDALNAKRQQGTFGPEDEKKEREVLKQFQKLVRDRSELQPLIAGTAAEGFSANPSRPAPVPLPQSLPQSQQHAASQPNIGRPGNNGAAENQQTEPSKPKPTPGRKMTAFPPQGDIQIAIECNQRGSEVACHATATNVGDTRHNFSPEGLKAIDNFGNEDKRPTSSAFHFGPSDFHEWLEPGVPVNFTVTVSDAHAQAEKISLFFRYIWGEEHPFMQLLNIPVTHE